MFLGEYTPNITEGSRVALPKKIREQVSGKNIVLSKGFEECIFGYEQKIWQKEAEKELSIPISDAKSRNLKRYMYSGAIEITLDSQGRFVVPPNLKKYAKITEKVIIIGAGDHFEIWDEDAWQKYLSAIEKEVGNE